MVGHPARSLPCPTMASVPRVVLGEPGVLVRELLRRACAQGGVHVVGEAVDADRLVALCQGERPDVALVSGGLADRTLDGVLDAVHATESRVVVISEDPSPERVTHLLGHGVAGYLMSDISPQQLAEAIHSVAAGASVLHPSATRTILDQWRVLRDPPGPVGSRRRTALTRRELDVLRAMTEGMSGKSIARHLGVALKTVENHKIRIFDKLGVRTQAQAVSFAISQGLVAGDRSPPVGADA
jgi:DNA-binding NarL/FixJ family response regulator